MSRYQPHPNRTAKAGGTLKIDRDQGRSRRVQRDAGKPDRLPTDQGGHFIAREFGGPKQDFNHFAQDAGFNKSEYRKLELQWRSLTEKGQKVKVEIVPRYQGDSKRPSLLDVSYEVGGERRTKTFVNPKKGK